MPFSSKEPAHALTRGERLVPRELLCHLMNRREVIYTVAQDTIVRGCFEAGIAFKFADYLVIFHSGLSHQIQTKSTTNPILLACSSVTNFLQMSVHTLS